MTVGILSTASAPAPAHPVPHILPTHIFQIFHSLATRKNVSDIVT